MSDFNSNFQEVLSRIQVDNYHFMITWTPLQSEACLIWIKNTDHQEDFEALGKFSQFDKRRIMEFVTRYTTNERFRDHIHIKQVSHRLRETPATYYKSLQQLTSRQKTQTFEALFNIDRMMISREELVKQKRLLAKEFHPDRPGGNSEIMVLINEAFDLFSHQ